MTEIPDHLAQAYPESNDPAELWAMGRLVHGPGGSLAEAMGSKPNPTRPPAARSSTTIALIEQVADFTD